MHFTARCKNPKKHTLEIIGKKLGSKLQVFVMKEEFRSRKGLLKLERMTIPTLQYGYMLEYTNDECNRSIRLGGYTIEDTKRSLTYGSL